MRIAFFIGPIALASGTPAPANPVSDRIYQPATLADTDVEYRGEAPTSLSVTTQDGLELEGLYWPPDEAVDQMVIVFHGNAYNHLVSAVRAEPLRTGGRGVVVASYRGYGDNPGEPSEEGLYRDAEAWIAKTRELHPDARIYLFGFSLGGAVAIEMAARYDFSGVATLGAFARLRDMVPRIARAFVKERYDNKAKIARVSEPFLLLQGTQDDVVDPKAIGILEAAGGPNVVRINLTGSGHWVPLEAIGGPI